MSWIGKLYETYENCASEIGKDLGRTDRAPLYPVAHTSQNAHLEICLDGDGNYLKGFTRVIADKAEQVTLIPCTDDSANRTSGLCAHPLFDKIPYVAGDYLEYGGEPRRYGYEEFMDRLEAWCASQYVHPDVEAVLHYLKKGNLLADLAGDGVFPRGPDGKIVNDPKAFSDEDRPEIFRAAAPMEAFVRFRVQRPGKSDRIWEDPTLWKSFQDYYFGTLQKKDVCYVAGESLPLTEKNPAKLRNTADKAKLISSNDASGFTYRGRFRLPEEAATLSYEASQKAHNALKWLIAKQGIRSGDEVYVAWGAKNQRLPLFDEDTCDLFAGLNDFLPPNTEEEFAKRLGGAVRGYWKDPGPGDGVTVLGVDSATPGRLSIIYYQELSAAEFLENVRFWHESCAWMHRYHLDYTDPKKPVRVPFYGAPSPKDIAFAAYGADDKARDLTLKRLVPCILERRPLPPDIVMNAARRAGNPVSMEPWEHAKTLSIACSLIRKYRKEKFGEGYGMSLERECGDRSYLFGRWLAYAKTVESYSMYASGNEQRQTNAERLMHQYSLRPKRTMAILNEQLVYYFRKLGEGKLGAQWKTEMNEIISRLEMEKFTDDKLDETYLLGYASQMEEFNKEREAVRAARAEKGEEQ